jgi:hypothetical protein
MRATILAVLSIVGLSMCKPHVTFQTYCEAEARAFCEHCVGGAGTAACIPAFVTSCIGSRDPSARTTATAEQMNQCAAALSTAECAAVIGGTVPPACNNR